MFLFLVVTMDGQLLQSATTLASLQGGQVIGQVHNPSGTTTYSIINCQSRGAVDDSQSQCNDIQVRITKCGNTDGSGSGGNDDDDDMDAEVDDDDNDDLLGNDSDD